MWTFSQRELPWTLESREDYQSMYHTRKDTYFPKTKCRE